MQKRTLAVVGFVAAALVIGTGGGAIAASQITGADVKNGSLTGKDISDGSLAYNDLSANAKASLQGKDGAQGNQGNQGEKGDKGAKGDDGAKGDTGDKGAKGDSGLEGAYYAVAFYDVGDTNAGAIATVGCSNQSDVAIAGGVQITGIDNSRNTPVSSSFPGRMDWTTNTPKANRLDGWIVQFGGNAGAVSDKDPLSEKIWALCVPGADIPVVTTYTQSD